MKAVIIGAGIGGLAGAKALSIRFNEVILVDRDPSLLTATERPAIAQAYHFHVLLTRGQRALYQLFPEIDRTLTADGCVAIDWGRDYALYTPFGWGVKFEAGVSLRGCSRSLLERWMRDEVNQLANVKTIEGCDVLRLVGDSARNSVVGIVVKDRATGAETELRADLVVDASGRNTKLADWLPEIGYPAPERQVVDAKIRYVSFRVKVKDEHRPEIDLTLIAHKSGEVERGGGLIRIEGGEYIATLYGAESEKLDRIKTWEDFCAFTKTLRDSYLYELLKKVTPISDLKFYGRTENRWYRFDQMAKFPAGLIAMGDAVCALNPIYGQGMSVAFMQAELLAAGNGLSGGLAAQKKLSRLTQTPWALATGADRVTIGGPAIANRSLVSRIFGSLFRNLGKGSTQSVPIRRLYREILHLEKPITATLRPDRLWKLMRVK